MSSDFAWVATAPADYDIQGEYGFVDKFSDFPLKVVCHGFEIDQAVKSKIEELCSVDDGVETTANAPELQVTALYRELPFTKLTNGFICAIGEILKCAMYKNFPVVANKPIMALRLKNGKDRLFIYNTDDDHYDHAVITCDKDTASVKVASHYPVLPPRFIQEQNTAFSFDYNKKAEKTNKFQVKLAPAGMTIVDIEF